MPEPLTIDRLGHRGDGIARGPHGPVYVPYTLPGERVLVEQLGDRAQVIKILTPSAERAAPPCRHFGRCGGCALQMLSVPATRRLKRDFVAAALARQGIAAEVDDTIGVSPASRRRAVLTALRARKDVLLGYNERLSNRLVDIEECPILAPALAAGLAGLKRLIGPLANSRKPLRVTALLTQGGLDIDITGAKAPPAQALPALAELAREVGVARLSLGGDPLLVLAEPVITVARTPLAPPPGVFVQASAEAEAIMAGLAVEHLKGPRRMADLFCGVGTFALALARHAPVLAVEQSQPALDALTAAARLTPGLKRIDTERRDLFAFPLAPAEMKSFDAIVFDPPRAGAPAQAAALAASAVPKIAAISCNPASFARDARLLVDGGYCLDRVVPVDQFVYSAETEVVGLFSRG